MARKAQVSIQDSVSNNEEFDAYIEQHAEQLICMEVYSDYCGNSQASAFAVRKGKLEVGGDAVAMVKALSDEIDALVRFKYKSEPTFLFIQKGKLTGIMYGANGIEFCRVVAEQLELMKREDSGGPPVEKQEITEMLPLEEAKLQKVQAAEKQHIDEVERLRALTLAARKRRVNERRFEPLQYYNFLMFFPHCHDAHFALYEKYDQLGLSVSNKEEIQVTEDMLKEIFYQGDLDLNEACLHKLMSGKVMVVLFKLAETDRRDIVKVMRQGFYEDLPVLKEDVPIDKQPPMIPAFDRYASISQPARVVRRERYNIKLEKLAAEKEEEERIAAEHARILRQEEEERQLILKKKQDEERMARIAAGLPADPVPEAEPEPEATGEEVAEGEVVEGEGVEGEEGKEKAEIAEGEMGTGDAKRNTQGGRRSEGVNEDAQAEGEAEEVPMDEEFHSDVEIEGEDYIPPEGQFVPGLYTPPNDYAKCNAIAVFFPKIVKGSMEMQALETEHLPPHMLVMFPADKRGEILDQIRMFKSEIIHVGVFVGDDPYHAEHVAFSIKQYNEMDRPIKHKDRIGLMVSRQRSLPLLSLATLNPCYISGDLEAGERDCLALFPVGYGDEFFEEESVVEEEVVIQVEEPPEPKPDEDEEIVLP